MRVRANALPLAAFVAACHAAGAARTSIDASMQEASATDAESDVDGGVFDADAFSSADTDAGDDATDGPDDACVPPGDATAMTVSAATLTSTSPLGSLGVTPCPPGWAHPNVCCLPSDPLVPAGGTSVPICVEYAGAPFQPCACAALTFPDPRACCPLDSAGTCVRAGAIEPEGGKPFDGSPPQCNFPCAPGGFIPGGALGGFGPPCTEAAQSDDAAALFCNYCCSSTGALSCVTNVCSCPNETPDSGGCLCGPQCGACPDGWQVPPGLPDMCCRQLQDGTPQCFSQANAILRPN